MLRSMNPTTCKPPKVHTKTSHTRRCIEINKLTNFTLNEMRLTWLIFRFNTTVMRTQRNQIIILLTCMMARF